MRNNLSMNRSIALFLIGLVLGAFVIIQSRSFQGVTSRNTRDASSNIFREIQILKDTNTNLQDEVSSLQTLLNQARDKTSSLRAIEEEIKKFETINGASAVYGPGVRVSVPQGVDIATLVDLANELLNAGAEAMSVNGIRFTGVSYGFDVIPNGQILLNSNILQPPYIFQAVGDPVTLGNALTEPGGILQRFEKSHPGSTLKIQTMERIDIDATK